MVLLAFAAILAAEGRTLLRGTPAVAAVASSSVVGGRHRRMLAAAPSSSASIASAKSAPLPADIFVMASPCPATPAAAGSIATATFTVGASLAPEQFKDVTLQVDFPKALWPSVAISCKTSTAQAITCDADPPSLRDLTKYDIVSTACRLGDLAATGPVTCTFSFTVPATPLPAGVNARQIVGAVTYADLPENVVEDGMNNAATSCVAAA